MVELSVDFGREAVQVDCLLHGFVNLGAPLTDFGLADVDLLFKSLELITKVLYCI